MSVVDFTPLKFPTCSYLFLPRDCKHPNSKLQNNLKKESWKNGSLPSVNLSRCKRKSKNYRSKAESTRFFLADGNKGVSQPRGREAGRQEFIVPTQNKFDPLIVYNKEAIITPEASLADNKDTQTPSNKRQRFDNTRDTKIKLADNMQGPVKVVPGNKTYSKAHVHNISIVF